jgi:hypothetical protein
MTNQPTTDESVVDDEPIVHDTTEADEGVLSWRERGASLVEYALLLGLIAIVCIGAITMLSGETADGPRGINNSASSIISAGGG